ncbi:hypothetical protein HEMROJRC1_08300 [Rodentibacter sp. JRC1]|nr:hypothetical protein HEMROJRC1_08300 [Rodentibacter sp. JRC1]
MGVDLIQRLILIPCYIYLFSRIAFSFEKQNKINIGINFTDKLITSKEKITSING